jgi:hypothetical protein
MGIGSQAEQVGHRPPTDRVPVANWRTPSANWPKLSANWRTPSAHWPKRVGQLAKSIIYFHIWSQGYICHDHHHPCIHLHLVHLSTDHHLLLLLLPPTPPSPTGHRPPPPTTHTPVANWPSPSSSYHPHPRRQLAIALLLLPPTPPSANWPKLSAHWRRRVGQLAIFPHMGPRIYIYRHDHHHPTSPPNPRRQLAYTLHPLAKTSGPTGVHTSMTVPVANWPSHPPLQGPPPFGPAPLPTYHPHPPTLPPLVPPPGPPSPWARWWVRSSLIQPGPTRPLITINTGTAVPIKYPTGPSLEGQPRTGNQNTPPTRRIGP